MRARVVDRLVLASRSPPRECSSRSRSTPVLLAASCARRSRGAAPAGHLGDELVDRRASSGRGRSRRPRRRGSWVGRHRAGRRAADVGMMGAIGGEAEVAAVRVRTPRDDRDVGQVRAAAKGNSFRTQATSPRCSSSSTASTAAGIAPRCTGIARLASHSPGGIEQRTRGVAALLEFAECAARISTAPNLLQAARRRRDDAQGDRVDAHRQPDRAGRLDGAAQPADGERRLGAARRSPGR